MAFLAELQQQGFEELLADFDRPIPSAYLELGDTYFEEVACELRRRDPEGGARELLARLPRVDPDRSSAIILALSLYGQRDHQYLAEFRAALQHPNTAVRAAAIDGLRALGDSGSLPDVEPLVSAEDPTLRAAALRFLAGVKHSSAVQHLRAALHDSDAYVRANAVEELVELVGARASGWISDLVDDPAEIVRVTVKDNLDELRDGGPDSNGL